ncbi:Nucleoporin nup57 [Elasticomyces elasticus]|nr:Nucleoporin nup57 [Elasticomyces elasticus]
MSLFGKPLSGPNNQSPFASSASQPQQTSSLFGLPLGGQQQPQQQQQQPNNTNNASSLFGLPASLAQPSNSLFPPQQQNQSTSSLFNNTRPQQPESNILDMGRSILTTNTNQAQQQQQLWNPGSTYAPREPSIPEQISIIFQKWSPDSPHCLAQTYCYNTVPPTSLPYFHPTERDDPREWEKALSEKPTAGSVPVLVRGFRELGARLSVQVTAVQELRNRLHEMNNSLTTVMRKHDVEIDVKIQESRRRSRMLQARVLSLAARVQMLRNRGYALDGAEEELRRKLAALEKNVCEPGFEGRSEEVWARLVGLRERARWLEQEGEKMGAAARSVAAGVENGSVIDEEVLKKTKKILSDYDAQLAYLRKELEEVQREFREWEAANATPAGGK